MTDDLTKRILDEVVRSLKAAAKKSLSDIGDDMLPKVSKAIIIAALISSQLPKKKHVPQTTIINNYYFGRLFL